MKKSLIILFLGIASFSLLVSTRVLAEAGATPTTVQATIDNPFKCTSVTGSSCTVVDFFKAIVSNVLLPIGSVLAVIFFVLAGFKFVTAQGDEKKIQEARNALLYTAIGTAILLGATLLADVISATVGSLQ